MHFTDEITMNNLCNWQ